MKKLSSILILSFLVAGCASTATNRLADAVAIMHAKSDSSVSGTVDFTTLTDGSVLVRVKLTGVRPGPHGIHIHAKGDCSAPDGSSAGGHFNPDAKEHGAPDATSHHAGDLGNVTADDKGIVQTEFINNSITLVPGPHSVIGRAVVVHARADDFESQPTGNSGPRIACGVIVGAKK